jgi:triosephosphate isomerase
MTVVGVRLKMYIGCQQTLDWCRDVTSRRTERVGDDVEIVVLPTFPALAQILISTSSTRIGVGPQDLANAECGAQTGEVTTAMLAELGCRYGEVGHAERRRPFGEIADVGAAKTANALDHVDGLFLGRIAYDPAQFAAVLGEARSVTQQQAVPA